MNQYPSTINYSGRQVDIELLQSITQPVSLQKMHLAVVSLTPKIVTGVEKLVQRYANIFLSGLTTVHYDTGYGTNILKDITLGMVSDKGRLMNEFADANAKTTAQLRQEDKRTDLYGSIQDDERLQSAKLLDCNIDFATSTAFLKIQLTTAAGDTIVFVLPTTAPRS